MLKKNITLREYRKILKESRDYLKGAGFNFKIKIVRGGKHYITGTVNIIDGNILIYAGTKTSRITRLFVLFHEIRHVEHHLSGKFKGYYETPNFEIGVRRLINKKILPDIKTGLRAELNCNHSALKRLRSFGYDLPKDCQYFLKYNRSDVLGYRSHINYILSNGYYEYLKLKNSSKTWFTSLKSF